MLVQLNTDVCMFLLCITFRSQIRSSSLIVVKIEKRSFGVWNKMVTFRVPSADIQPLFSGTQKGAESICVDKSLLLINNLLRSAELSVSNKGHTLTFKFELPASDAVRSRHRRVRKPMLTFFALKDKALPAGVAPAVAKADLEHPEVSLDHAIQALKDLPGSLLDELGRARDAVEIILNISINMAEVGLFISLLNACMLITNSVT